MADRRRWAEASTGARAGAVLGVLAGLTVVGLAVTGALLSTRYRPNTDDLPPGSPDSLVLVQRLVDAHRGLTVVLLVLTLAGAALAAGRAVRSRLRKDLRVSPVPTVVALVAVTTVAIAAATGFQVAWDQLALEAVTVGTGLDGVWHAAFGDGVRFVLIDGTEVSQSDYATALVVHVALVPVVVLGVAGIAQLVRRHRRGRRAPDQPSDQLVG